MLLCVDPSERNKQALPFRLACRCIHAELLSTDAASVLNSVKEKIHLSFCGHD